MGRNSYIFLFIILLVNHSVFSQEKLISGRIVVKDATVQGVHIINLVNEKEAISDVDGKFAILAKTEDLLVFSAVHLDYMRKIIEDTDYNSGTIIIQMTSKINQLDEVEISENNINALSLGILSKPIKSLTPAERRLKAGTGIEVYPSFGTMSGAAIGTDALINWISGRTKLLKQELKLEKKEILLRKTDGLYEDSYYTDTLKIPKDYIKAFQYYCIENEKFVTAINAKNGPMVAFVMSELAFEYNTLLKDEKK